jgi:hypothetical protein
MLRKHQVVAVILSITNFIPFVCGQTRDVSHGTKGRCYLQIVRR